MQLYQICPPTLGKESGAETAVLLPYILLHVNSFCITQVLLEKSTSNHLVSYKPL